MNADMTIGGCGHDWSGFTAFAFGKLDRGAFQAVVAQAARCDECLLELDETMHAAHLVIDVFAKRVAIRQACRSPRGMRGGHRLWR